MVLVLWTTEYAICKIMVCIILSYDKNIYILDCDLLLTVFASTAADPYQSSYACYFDEMRQTYLGDVYSVNWMQDSDKVRATSTCLHCSVNASVTLYIWPTWGMCTMLTGCRILTRWEQQIAVCTIVLMLLYIQPTCGCVKSPGCRMPSR